MVFFLNLLFSLIYSFCIGKWYCNKQISSIVFLLLFLPLIGIWLLICGGQDGVGTDYGSYLGLFNGEFIDYYKNTGEILFYYIIFCANQIGLKGQILFYVFYGIDFLFLFLFLKRVDLKYLFIFILLYITVSNMFNNQLSAVRQTTAVYIGSYACLKLFENKKKYFFLLWVIASLIHSSAWCFILLWIFKYVKKINFRILYLLLIGSFVIGHSLNTNWISLFIEYLTPTYAAVVKNTVFEEKSFLVKVTKYVFIPIYWLSITLIKNKKLTNKELLLYNLGFFAFCLRIFLINITYIGRISELFFLFSLFPLYYYLRDLYVRKRIMLLLIIFLGLSSMYFIKTVLIPKDEYAYESIYF